MLSGNTFVEVYNQSDIREENQEAHQKRGDSEHANQAKTHNEGNYGINHRHSDQEFHRTHVPFQCAVYMIGNKPIEPQQQYREDNQRDIIGRPVPLRPDSRHKHNAQDGQSPHK